MEVLNGVKKRHFRAEAFQWPFSTKREKISRDINVATPSPPPLPPHPSSLLLTCPRAAWSRVQSTLGSKKDHGGDLMNKKRQLELWDFAGFSREKLKLLKEIEALIDSEENALNMEASAKAAEGRLRSLLDICVCSQCQENIENRIALPKTMERDRVAFDNFLQKQRLKHEASKQKLKPERLFATYTNRGQSKLVNSRSFERRWNTIEAYPGMIIMEPLENFWSSCPSVTD
ncbi:hypothetical protein SELMODRAFT_432345 [Selaginella moellendorffii]|uniref:Uncharacterized protein n=1 Tax=Selaginella moellendorffii TaxID=88036 RepID=D8TFQ5_SELML|nr:hypothetical protein SELMODRAFT_432345 [Selaginella moellendorffii]